jgi:predicted AAA+ superfamily ATPase
VHYASADEPTLRSAAWIAEQWEVVRSHVEGPGSILILDEVQKIPGWSESVKRLWDEDTRKKLRLKVVLLGSAPLLIQHGLAESLSGRFEIIPVGHWSFTEMHQAFGWTLNEYIYYGGYPGSASLVSDRNRWASYVTHSLIETTISRDILLMTRVDKPALLRQLFQLGCSYSGQIVSYQKLVGQLQDAGNTTTIAHYLTLLAGAGMLSGLQKYSRRKVRQRASSPKLLVLNTALVTAQSELTLDETQRERDLWGRLVESSVGAHLINRTVGLPYNVYYWREGIKEVDFIIQKGKSVTALEVKSGRRRENLSGVEAFQNMFRPRRTILIGEGGIGLEEFFLSPISAWVD